MKRTGLHRIAIQAGLFASILCATTLSLAQGLPSAVASFTAQGGTVPFVNWLDDIWTDHLAFRAEASGNAPLLREAFLRDALRLDPDKVAVIDALARHYRAFGMTPMDLAMMAYGRRIAPQHNEWAALAGDETASAPNYSSSSSPPKPSPSTSNANPPWRGHSCSALFSNHWKTRP